ncbi:hypothetical protein D9757_010423 [Collybiopsis confluens]|uniref:Heme haloperoxidase family profile domain-containing protein n=1 Tax=Collybiopsis confluens TaxID=2823264 RepID=A0A8H5LTG7_9AGAR|nr:hypothetical protein D9757_010423 [Collybiopsis confluens]
MKFFSIAFLASALAVAVKADVDWSAHQWQKPGPDDSRGPCPGLNTLANHGFLPRNGQNITVQNILDAVNDGFNFRPIDIMVVAAKVALLSTDNVNYVTLEESGLYGNIEHDTSLSRQDFDIGDSIHFNETIYQTLANSNPGVDYYNITSAAQVVEQRLVDDKLVNPNLINTIKEFTFRTRESAFYLSTMGNVTADSSTFCSAKSVFLWKKAGGPLPFRSMIRTSLPSSPQLQTRRHGNRLERLNALGFGISPKVPYSSSKYWSVSVKVEIFDSVSRSNCISLELSWMENADVTVYREQRIDFRFRTRTSPSHSALHALFSAPTAVEDIHASIMGRAALLSVFPSHTLGRPSMLAVSTLKTDIGIPPPKPDANHIVHIVVLALPLLVPGLPRPLTSLHAVPVVLHISSEP